MFKLMYVTADCFIKLLKEGNFGESLADPCCFSGLLFVQIFQGEILVNTCTFLSRFLMMENTLKKGVTFKITLNYFRFVYSPIITRFSAQQAIQN